jgi:hypothetical protein
VCLDKLRFHDKAFAAGEKLQSFFAGTDTSFSVATAVESCAITEINAKVRFRESEVEAAN